VSPGARPPLLAAGAELVRELAQGLRAHVLPLLGSHAGRAHTGSGAGGDVTFAIDAEAETFLERFLAERAPDVAFYSEDRGLVLPDGAARPVRERHADDGWRRGDGRLVLLVDPIDGTRPAMAGLESCCVSVAAAAYRDASPTMGDVEAGCIVELKSGVTFVAERGRGVSIDGAGGAVRPSLSRNEELGRLFWTSGFRGRPAAPVVTVLEELIDASSVGGAFFDLGSATFDATRIVTGQLDAYVDVGSLMIEEQPGLRQRFEEVGGGAILNNSPYDLAAAVLVVAESGAVVTDARGVSLDGRPLLGSGHGFQMSCVAAANRALHHQLVDAVGRGIERLRSRST
jgi:myo-inositol-1(or 4)-monophosphatase